MPRFRRVPRQPKVKVPKPVKLQRPKVKDLKTVLKGLITVSMENRLAALAYILQWYDKALPYIFQKKLMPISQDPNKPTAEQKRLSIAVKARKQAIGTVVEHEKETALLLAVRSYEMACAALKPASVDVYYKMFEVKKAELEAKQVKLEQKYGLVVKMLQLAIGNRIKLVVADAEKLVQYNPNLSSLSYNREAVRTMAQQYRAEGLLPVFADQLDILSQHAALESDGHGGWQYDPARHVKILNEMLASFIQFAKSPDGPTRLVRNGVVRVTQPQPTAVPGTPRAHRPGPVGKRGPLVGGCVPAGTGVAALYELIKDGQVHPLQEILKKLNVPDGFGRVGNLHRSAQRHNAGHIVTQGRGKSPNDTIQFVHSPGHQP